MISASSSLSSAFDHPALAVLVRFEGDHLGDFRLAGGGVAGRRPHSSGVDVRR